MNSTSNRTSNVVPISQSSGSISPKTAATFTAGLADLMATIPDLQLFHPIDRKRLRAAASVSTEHIAAVIAAIQSSPELQGVAKMDLEAAREAIAFRAASDTIIKALQEAIHNLRYTADLKKAGVAFDALQIYQIAKGMARSLSGAPLVEHVANMKKTLGKVGPRKKRGAAQPAASVATPERTTAIEPAQPLPTLSLTATMATSPARS